jgi:predicted DNA-binding WGR domain protein
VRLAKQSRLEFREGSSDKVYEVDLCELAPGSFTVNFRYGRRGSVLKEGTKTTRPVPRSEAERLFDELVASKTKKGYQTAGAPEASIPGAVSQKPAPTAGDRATALLRRLSAGPRRDLEKAWPLTRAIWRAGELRIPEAAPLLVKLFDSKNPLRNYCIAWALGWCGDTSVMPELARLFHDASTPDHVRRIAREALLKLSDEPTREAFRGDMAARLDDPLRALALEGTAEAFEAAFARYAEADPSAAALALETLYLVDNETVRPAVLTTLRSAPFSPHWFRALRHVYKAAEYRRDAEAFGILAYRMEKERPKFREVRWDAKRISVYGASTNRMALKRETLLGADATTCFGEKTRHYLRRRSARTLTRLGQLADPDFVRMAVGVLIPFTDADANTVAQSVRYRWTGNRSQPIFTNWGPFAQYLALNTILYGNSPRYELAPSGHAWRCRRGFNTADAEPSAREEAFGSLWERTPAGLLHLVSESECLPVHTFAVKVLRACPDFCRNLDVDVIAMLLDRSYDVTVRLAFELAVARYDPNAPDPKLILALATCPLAEARDRARTWIDAHRDRLATDADFVAALAVANHEDARAWARTLILSTSYSEHQSRVLVDRLLESLVALDTGRAETARDLARTLLDAFRASLRSLDLRALMPLVDHPLASVQELAAQILLDHVTPADEFPADLLSRLVASDHETVRGLGVRLVGQLPEARLLERDDVLIALVASPLGDVRTAARALVRRLAAPNPEVDPNLVREGIIAPREPRLVAERRAFVERLGARIVQLFELPESVDGVRDDLARVLLEDLVGWVGGASLDTARSLVGSGNSAAQHVGGSLLSAHSEWAREIATDELAAFGRHEIKSVRDAAQILFATSIHRFHRISVGGAEELIRLIRVLDNQWSDAREFWFMVFRTFFQPEDLPAAVLVAMCDSPREDVRALGRELITRHFRHDDGLEYLAKLSEHPSPDMRSFVTNFLDRFVAGDPTRLASLRLYFVTVLSAVNTSRVAKTRVIAFLRAEAAANEDAARVVADVFERLSLTSAIGDRAASIEALLDLRRSWPSLSLPIAVRPVALRSGATGSH